MAGIKEAAKTVSLIADRTGKSGQEVHQMIKEKREKFAGLLTNAGAAMMVARELGVGDLIAGVEIKICDLKEGMCNVNVAGRVKRVFARKEFEKNGRKGQLQNLVLWDGSTEIRATIWDSDVEKFGGMCIKRGTLLRMRNCSVSKFNNTLQLNLKYNSGFDTIKDSGFPPLESNFRSITELEHGLNGVDVEVWVKKIFPAREFETGSGKGRVMNFIISEGVNDLRATAWQEQCKVVEEIGEGEEVRIEGGYVRESRKGIELHVGKGARVFANRK